ncbi:MAG: pentapeptide repeat-containing protein [Rhodobacteraceae bacterium]|nr:pentapeptide repeat-containing protein [Paracoccaceae bacterium]
MTGDEGQAVDKTQIADEKQLLDHIEDVSRNARGTWLTLIAVLLFSAIAVAGVRDRDFFTYGASMTLPVINFSVPVKSFFYAGPLIVLGLYTYLHLYLLKLWRALAVPAARLANGRQLDEAVFPWLVSDAAISIKPGGPRRPFGWMTRIVAFLFLWAAGPMILIYFWWRSFPPHDLSLTTWTGLLAGLSIVGGVLSFNQCWQVLRPREERSPQRLNALPLVISLCAGGGILFAGLLRTDGVLGLDGWIYSADLYRAELVQRPAGWMSREEAWEEFKVKYSGLKRHQMPDDATWLAAAKDAFNKQRTLMLDGLKANDFQGVSFRYARLEEAFMPGLDLKRANFKGANLYRAYMEETDLSETNLQAGLWAANLQASNLSRANFEGADLSDVNLEGAILIQASLQTSNLSGANLSGANLWHADLKDAQVFDALFVEASLASADLSSVAFLSQAQINSAFGTGPTKLVDGGERPPHWSDKSFEIFGHEEAWSDWRSRRFGQSKE